MACEHIKDALRSHVERLVELNTQLEDAQTEEERERIKDSVRTAIGELAARVGGGVTGAGMLAKFAFDLGTAVGEVVGGVLEAAFAAILDQATQLAVSELCVGGEPQDLPENPTLNRPYKATYLVIAHVHDEGGDPEFHFKVKFPPEGTLEVAGRGVQVRIEDAFPRTARRSAQFEGTPAAWNTSDATAAVYIKKCPAGQATRISPDAPADAIEFEINCVGPALTKRIVYTAWVCAERTCESEGSYRDRPREREEGRPA